MRVSLELAGNFQLSEPRPSYLNAKEQKIYLGMLTSAAGGGDLTATMGQTNYNLFREFQELVKEEQREFQTFVKGVHELKYQQFTQFLEVETRSFVADYFKAKLARVSEEYPKLFMPIGRLDTPDSMLRMVPLCNEQSDRPQVWSPISFFVGCQASQSNLPDFFQPRSGMVKGWVLMRCSCCCSLGMFSFWCNLFQTFLTS